MTEAHTYEDSGGRSWRLRLVQVIDVDPMFDGVVHTFSVEAAGPGGDAERGFEISVRYAPIFYDLLTLAQRRQLRRRSLGLVESLLDRGHEGPGEIRVSSDGAAIFRGEVLEWCLALRQPA